MNKSKHRAETNRDSTPSKRTVKPRPRTDSTPHSIIQPTHIPRLSQPQAKGKQVLHNRIQTHSPPLPQAYKDNHNPRPHLLNRVETGYQLYSKLPFASGLPTLGAHCRLFLLAAISRIITLSSFFSLKKPACMPVLEVSSPSCSVST